MRRFVWDVDLPNLPRSLTAKLCAGLPTAHIYRPLVSRIGVGSGDPRTTRSGAAGCYPTFFRRAGAVARRVEKYGKNVISKNPCFPVIFPKHVSLVFCIFPLMRLSARVWDGYFSTICTLRFGPGAPGSRLNRKRWVSFTPGATLPTRERVENCRVDLWSRKRPARRVSTLRQHSRHETACFSGFLRK
jgi:hypothetical protein